MATFECTFLLGEAADRDAATKLLDKFSERPQVEQALDQVKAVLARYAFGHHDRNAGSRDRSDGQRLAAVPEYELPDVGTIGLLPAGRRVRLSRSAAGRGRARLPPARHDARRKFCATRPSSSSKATCCIGGTRTPATACGRDFPTTCCGCRTWRRSTSQRTGDAAILDEELPFITAPPLADGQQEAYLRPSPSGERAARCTSIAAARSIAG